MASTASSALTLRPELSADVCALITHLTEFDEDEDENFWRCYDFAASNLLYHHYLDPVERTVDRAFEGLREKFLVHAEKKRAEDLGELLRRYNQSEVFKQPLQQFDARIRVLSLLWHLSKSPLEVQWDGIKVHDVKEGDGRDREKLKPLHSDEDDINWRKLLAEGEEVWSPGSEGELSEWTDEDEQLEGLTDEKDEKVEKVKPQLIDLDPETAANKALEDAKEELRSLIQPQYWRDNECTPKVDSSEASARFSVEVDCLLRRSGVEPSAKRYLSEYQLVRECLWSLRNPCSSTVFARDRQGRFHMVENVCIPSVTAETLADATRDITLVMGHLRSLLNFKEDVFREQKNFAESLIPFTYEAFAGGLSELLNIFYAHLLKIESKVLAGKETFSLLDLIHGLEDWPALISAVAASHERYVTPGDLEDNWQKALRLIAGLHMQLCVESNKKFNVFLNLFLKTCFPYFRILGTWLEEGRLEDFRDEFVFCKDPLAEEEDQRFWSEGFKKRPYETFLEEKAGLLLPPMFEEAFPLIFTSGKSIEILTILRKKKVIFVDDGEMSIKNGSPVSKCLLNAFLDGIKEELLEGGDPDRVDGVNTDIQKSPLLEKETSGLDHENLDLDPYLLLAFGDACHDDRDECDASTVEEGEFYLIRDVESLKQVFLVFSRCLSTPVRDYYHASSCQALTSLFMSTLDLPAHLSAVRKVLLLEAGDLMFEFYTELFRRLESKEDLEESSLTLYLQDCLARRHPDEAERFSVVFLEVSETSASTGDELLDTMRLTYSLDWPVSMVLDSKSLETYNQVFLFLLKVKRALWALGRIQAKNLAAATATTNDLEEAVKDNYDEDFPISLKIHRVLLLRSWLLHFVGNVHAYFMSRVLHSTEIQLTGDLKECLDFDQILGTHRDYLVKVFDRCFLHPSARVLREAVLRVLRVCLDLARLVNDEHLDKLDMESLKRCEVIYARSHQFLASTLSSMTQKRNVPHLDGLAAALLHSCPASVT